MKRKVLSLFLILILVLGLGACGSASSGTGSSSADSASEDTSSDDEVLFTIGYPAMTATSTAMEAIKLNRQAVAEAFGGELITEEWDFSAEGTVSAVEKLIERGCDGIIITPTDESILPTITSMCEEAGVYWAISMRTIEDEEIKEIVYASEYYVGYVYEPGVEIGNLLAQAAVDAGCTTYALLTASAGDTDATIREEGIAEIADAAGLECVSTIRGLSDATDATEAVESLIAAYPDLDCIIRVTSNVAGDGVAVCEAIEEAGKADDITFISFNTEEGMEEYLENGVLDVAFADVNTFDSLLVATILCNVLVGTPCSDDKIEINLYYSEMSSLDQYENFNAYINTTDAALYTEEEIQELLMGISLEDLQTEIIDTYSIESVAARKEE